MSVTPFNQSDVTIGSSLTMTTNRILFVLNVTQPLPSLLAVWYTFTLFYWFQSHGTRFKVIFQYFQNRTTWIHGRHSTGVSSLFMNHVSTKRVSGWYQGMLRCKGTRQFTWQFTTLKILCQCRVVTIVLQVPCIHVPIEN